jgi:hypothetical protein
MNESGETWYVKLANGDVHPVTVDQLDWAFEQGHVDANTLVLSADADGWMRLGEVAGLDDEPPARAPTAPPAAAPPPARVAAPVPVVRLAAPAYVQSPTPTAVSYAPRPAAYVAPVPVPSSLRPVSMDLDDFDLNNVPFKARSGKGWVVAVLSLAVIAGGGSVAANRLHLGLGSFGASSDSPPAAAAQPPPPVETHVPYQTPAPAVTVAPGPVGDSPLNPRFTDAQKDALLKADKKHDEKSEKTRTHTASSGHASGKYKSLGFTTGGNKYDPLNSNL